MGPSLILDAIRIEGESATARLPQAVAQALCEGHFPQQAIVPGAYLVGLMAELSQTLLAHRHGTPLPLKRMDRCVFHHPVFPDVAEILVRTDLAGATDSGIAVRAQILVDGRRMARALLAFGAPL